MTRKEAIEILKQFKKCLSDVVFDEKGSEAWQMAIQALSQEPTEKPMTVDEMEREYEKSKALFHKIVESDDAISREYLFKVLDDFCGHDRTATITLDTLADLVYELPSVTPSRRKGHWITKIDDTAHNFPFGKRVECSECGQRFVTGDDVSRNFCPKCGAKMESEEISERNMKMWEEIFKAESEDKK